MTIRTTLWIVASALAAAGAAVAGVPGDDALDATGGYAVLDGRPYRLEIAADGEARSLTVLTPDTTTGRDAEVPAEDSLRWLGADADAAFAMTGFERDPAIPWTAVARYTVTAEPTGNVTTITVGRDAVRIEAPPHYTALERGDGPPPALVAVNGVGGTLDVEAHRHALSGSSLQSDDVWADAWRDPARFRDGVARMARLVGAAQGAVSPFATDCTWECLFCAGMWVGTGLTAITTTASCVTVAACAGGALTTALVFATAVDACIACDRCQHPDPDPDPSPGCPEGFGPCSPISPYCCELPHCPIGQEPCEFDEMSCCEVNDCLPLDCPY